MNEIYIALPFVLFIASLFLASVVVFSDPSNRVNRLFTLFLVSMAAWGIGIFSMRDAYPDASLAYLRERWVLAIIPFSGIFYHHFVLRYTKAAGGFRLQLALYALGITSAALSLTGQSATGMVVKFYGFAPQLGWAFPLVLLAAYPPVLLGLVRIQRVMRTTDDVRERQRLNLLRLGVLASVLGGTTDFIPSLGIDIYPMGILGNLGFVTLATWGVTRYRLMNLRLVLRRGMAYTIVSALLFAVYGICYGAVILFARGLSPAAAIIAGVGTVLMVGVFVQPVMARVQVFVDRAFFRDRYDRVAGLARLNEQAKDITNFGSLAGSIAETIRKTAQADWVAILLPDRKMRAYASFADSRDAAEPMALDARGEVVSSLRRRPSVLRCHGAEVGELVAAMSSAEQEAFEAMDAHLLVPLTAGSGLTGILAVGRKLVGTDFGREDIEFLKAAADQAAIAVENARLYDSAMREANERTGLAELGRVVSSTLDIRGVLERCAQQVRRLLPADRVMVVTASPGAETFSITYVSGLRVPGWDEGAEVILAGSPIESVVRDHNGMIVTGGDSSVEDASHRHEMQAASRKAGFRALLAVPLLARDGVIGALILESPDPDAYSSQELELAERIGLQVANAVSNSQLYEQALQLAEEREARARLDAENRELQRINEAKMQFLSTVSHELKTPLTSMLAFADLLKRNKEGNFNEKELRHLDVIKRNGRMLSVLIQDLLDLSRIESGTLKLAPSQFDMRDLVRDLEESFAPLLGMKNQRMHVSVPIDPLEIVADRDRMAQVVSNLMSNASKYSPDGTQVEVELWKSEEGIHLSVTDHGIGISEADQKQLFTSFFRADNPETRAVQGTGLGLVIAKGIVEMHGGAVKLTSKLGKGTRIEFHVTGLDQAPEEVGGIQDAAA